MNDDLKISEIREKYHGHWVVVEVTKVDKYNNPLRGRVLSHNVDEAEVARHGRKYREEYPKADLYYFFAGQAIPTGIGVVFVEG
jgi:hypothetical protein